MRPKNNFLWAGFFGFLLVIANPSAVLAFGAKSAETPKADAESAKKEETVWVLRSDGGKSCSPETAQSVEAGAQELTNAKIRVLNSMKGDDGKMRIQMCGAPTGALNTYLIPKDALPQAIALGYKEAPANGVKPSKKK